ncbi:hypothetical protein F8S13_27320 [Chloroflexia bacterium SDU3-3]|nr:hypothetical protein F8S13_27320 [Chloroflexia bacterium SDU3-3]
MTTQLYHASARGQLAADTTNTTAFIRSAILMPGRPARLSRMNGATAARKYTEITDRSFQLTEASLQDHAAGRTTYAASLDQVNQARAGAIDVDTGGRAAVARVLAAAAQLGLTAWATLASTEGGHTGGHVWACYDGPTDALAIAAQLASVAALAGAADAEIWPRNQGIRLPFGYHWRAHTWGQLLTQDGQLFDLDNPAERRAALAYVATLPRNTTPPPLPEAPKPAQRAPLAPAPLQATESTVAAVRERYNAAHPLDELLPELGAQRTRDGYTCPCGVAHTHETTLFISKRGKLFSLSPRCAWYTTRGWDAFGLYVLTQHGNDVRAALRTLNPRTRAPQPAGACYPPHPADGPQRPAQRAQRAASEAQHKREARAAAAAAQLAQIDATLRLDDRLPTRAQLLAMLLLDHGHLQVRTTNAAAAAQLACSERTIQYAFRDLERSGYGRRTGGRGGAARANEAACWTWADVPRVQVGTAVTAPQGAVCALDIYKHDHDLTQEACERPAASPSAVLAPEALAAFDAFDLVEGGERVPSPLGELERRGGNALPPPCLPAVEAAPLAPSGGRSQAQGLADASVLVAADGRGEACASFDPAAATPPQGSYTGRSKHLADVDTILAGVAWLSEHYRATHPVPVAEPAEAAEIPPPVLAVPRAPRHVRYRATLATLSALELAKELRRLHAVLRSPKVRGAFWARDYEEKRELVQQEIDRREPEAPAATTGWGVVRAPASGGQPVGGYGQAVLFAGKE